MPTNSEEIEALKIQVKALEQRLAALESAIQVAPGPALTITAAVVTVHATTKMVLNGGAALDIKSSSVMDLKSGLIRLN